MVLHLVRAGLDGYKVTTEAGKSRDINNYSLSEFFRAMNFAAEANIVLNREVIISFDLSYRYTQTTISHRDAVTIFDPRSCLVALADIDNNGQR